MPTARKALAILGLLVLLVPAQRAWARGCLAAGTMVSTPGGPVAVEQLRPGDGVCSVSGKGLLQAQVVGIFSAPADELLEIRAGGAVLLVTDQHPVQTADGTFTEAAFLKVGDSLCLWRDGALCPVQIESLRPVRQTQMVYNLLVSPGGTYLANGLAVHNKGCFLPDTPILKADGSQSPISEIRPGDQLLAFTPEGKLVTTSVEQIIKLDVDEYCRVTTDQLVLEVTPEHPFFVGKGTFRTLESLKIGDEIIAVAQGRLRPQKIIAIEHIHRPTIVYNLQTADPHTFFAHGIAVHNKGGCFAAGTMVQTVDGLTAIERITPGQAIIGVKPDGRLCRAMVLSVFATHSSLLLVHCGDWQLRTTAAHPIALADGGFAPAGELRPGQHVLLARNGQCRPATITAIEQAAEVQPVFNLTVDDPHTFIADGFVVHNKGGGFGGGSHGGSYYGGSYHSSGSSTQSSFSDSWPLLVFGVVAVFIFAGNIWRSMTSGASQTCNSSESSDQDLDFVIPRARINAKAVQTDRVMAQLAKTDPSVNPTKLCELVSTVFLQLQKCWQARDYSPMQPLLMADLYHSHQAQLAAMIRQHEIDHLDQLQILHVDLVSLRYTTDPQQREFTALITASAKDYYTDDRSGKIIRGDSRPTAFQEFWIFHFFNGQWLLREIEQSRESDALKNPNYVQTMSESELAQAAGLTGDAAADPVFSAPLSRLDAKLLALAKQDAMWERPTLMSRARDTYLAYLLAQEAGSMSGVDPSNFTSDFYSALKSDIESKQAKHMTVEYHNLCVRKVEIVLAQENADRNQCQYTARISAHAQIIRYLAGSLVSKDDYEKAFECYATLQFGNGQWQLQKL